MTVYLLPDEPFFPPVEEAEPDGLIAIGGDLSVTRLLQAYAQGIFPWFLEDEDYFWYSPDPRMVLFPEQYRLPASLKRIINSNRFEVRTDTGFARVIRSCSEAGRTGQDGTWISGEFIDAYTELYNHGYAHSVETYFQGELVGGLYGVSIGAAFFGESMFFKMSNASKVAFHGLVELSKKLEFRFIDCQVETSHLTSMGARLVARRDYLELLTEAIKKPTLKGPWK
ncbi:MAG: leucyl/phenylalanyl-tRNA--protein transferase [Bacteroidota bacterium]